MRNWLALLAMIVALGLVTPTLMADHGKHKGNEEAYFDDDDQDERWEHRDGYEYRVYRDQRPPGWSRGKKAGWCNCGLASGPSQEIWLPDLCLPAPPLLLLRR